MKNLEFLGNITMEDVITAMPWANTIDVVVVPGRTIFSILEHSVSQYDASHPDPGGRFLQLSGLIVTFDVREPVGRRVKKVRLGRPEAPAEWAEVEDDGRYSIAVASFMVKGGDGYAMIPDTLVEHKNTGMLDNDLLVNYVSGHSPISAPTAGRIVVLDKGSPKSSARAISTLSIVPFLLSCLIDALL